MTSGVERWKKKAVQGATLAALLLVLLSTFVTALHGQSEQTPNLVLILADDLGYGDLGCYGQRTLKTPHIDRLAQRGVRFTQHYSGSTVCAPSRCVLMTGRHTGHAFIRGNARHDLPLSELTVAEVARCAGYRTGIFGKWGLGGEGSVGVPTRQGFDQFFGYLDQLHAHNYYPTFLYRNDTRVALDNQLPEPTRWGQGYSVVRNQYSHDLIVDEALQFIDNNHAHRFFLYLPITLPHANNEGGTRGMEVPEKAPFDDPDWPEAERGFAAMVYRLDRDVGRIVDKLAQCGLSDKTLILFSSDNGPHSEGGHAAAFFDSNGALRGIKRDLTEGGIRVPLIAVWPGVIEGQRVSHHVSYFGDLLATVAQLVNVTLATEHDGVSFVPELRGQPQPHHPFLYWEFYERGGSQGVRYGRWKGIRRGLGQEQQSIALYDVGGDSEAGEPTVLGDIGEQHDVADEHADVVDQIREIMTREHRPDPRWPVPKKRNP